MKRVVPHPRGVLVDGRLYRRDEFYAADHVSLREVLALGALLLGLLLWVALLIGGTAWLISQVVHRR
jgi:4-hydroxybenzoate polyprenyltransferase